MQTVLIVIHLMVVLALVVVVLLQRSEGGGLGIGGGGGGGFMTGRGQANLLTRTTAILAGIFFLTSLLLSIHAGFGGGSGSLLDRVQQPAAPGGSGQPAPQGTILDQLRGPQPPAQPAQPAQPAPAQPSGPQVPQSQ